MLFAFRQTSNSKIYWALRRTICYAVHTSFTRDSFVSRSRYISFPLSLSFRINFSSIAGSIKMADKKQFQRLPGSVVPLNYNITLKPNLAEFKFEGSEDISLQVKNGTKSVVMNSAEITVQTVKYTGNGQEISEGVDVAMSVTDESLTLTFPEELKPGNGTLSLKFTGELNDKMKGFYRSKYYGPDGDERYGAVTQFEATDARRAFPCWDEPAIKATFDITLIVPENRVAISNMPEKSSTPCESDSTCKVVKYERTPIMSTYLVAFVVGEYDYVEDTDADGVKVRVYTGVNKKEQGEFALKVAVQTLPFYKKYFDIAYPLPKIDLIAISDFAAGAMENWGLVTYRETALLIDPANSSASTRQWVALVVGHELAHQWFGNLVTMEWWTHLWLNEGFASWIEYLCVDHCFPDFDIWTQFASSDFARALELDALKNSHPIEVPVGHPDEIDEIFDAISYSKGASVIRMLHDYIGDKDFRKGMHEYLTKHKYKNTFTEDLWDALQDASGKPVQKIMTTWTKQMGFPVLKVSEKKEGRKRTLTIAQQKFCADGALEENTSEWMVPISVSTKSSPTKAIHSCVLDTRQTTITLNDVAEGDWLKLNAGAVGFYRTQYSSDMLEALIPAISDGSLPPRDRLGLQNDLFALARAGVASTVDFLKVAQAFQEETNYTVWTDLNSNIQTLNILLQHTDVHDQYKAYIRKLFANIYGKIGWDGKESESPLDAMLRGLVIGRLGSAGDQAVISEAKKRFASHADESTSVPADLRAPVYRTVLREGGQVEYDQLLKLFRSADLHEEKVRVMRSLGANKDKSMLQKTLDFALSDGVRSQDTVFVIGGVTGSVEGRDMAWQFLQNKWKILHDRYEGGFLLSRLVKFTTDSFASEDKAKEVEAFFKEHKAPAAARTIQQSLENIRLNASQLQRDGAAVKAFLCDFK